MNKPAYTEYVRHAMRFYARNQKISDFKSNVDRKNWMACADAIAECSEQEREILVNVYAEYDTLSDNVYKVAKKYGINQSVVWDMMRAFERKTAKHRGLIG